MGLLVAGLSLAACGAGSTSDSPDNSGTTEAGEGTVRETAERSGATTSARPDVVFIEQKSSEGMRAVMEALARGKVMVDDAGCIRLESGRAYHGDLIVWPPDYSMQVKGDEILIIKEDGQTLARVGDRVELGGGQVSFSSGAREAYKKHLKIPEKCTGPLGIVGQVVSTTR